MGFCRSQGRPCSRDSTNWPWLVRGTGRARRCFSWMKGPRTTSGWASWALRSDRSKAFAVGTADNSARPINDGALWMGFRPPGRVTFFLLAQEESNQRRRSPGIRPLTLRARGSLIPSLFQGHVAEGHPWPIAPLAATMPLNPLQSDSIRPSGGTSPGPILCCERADACWPEVAPPCIRRAEVPVRRPSGGVTQGDEPQGCGERLKGPWMALVSRPPEWHRWEGTPPKAGPDVGVPFFLVTLSWANKKK